jgi:hypothetical protein
MDQRLREAWHARERAFPIYPVLHLASEGLILGAGTVLVPAQEARQLTSLDGREARVLALLSAAYGKAVAPAVLGNIARAADAWRRGDDCLAYIHLAHSRLPELQDSYEAARRLFLAEGFLEAGGNPRGVLEALNLDAAHIDAIEKVYNPAEPRVPAGSGRTSGQWTRLLSVLGDLSAEAAEQLESFALRLLGASLSEGAAAAAAFGLLFIPSPNDLSVEGEVAGLPGLSYAWNRDESTLHLTYDNPDGGRSTSPLNWRTMSFATSAAKSSAAFCRTAPSRSTLPRSPPIWRKMINRSCVRHPVPTTLEAARSAATMKTT